MRLIPTLLASVLLLGLPVATAAQSSVVKTKTGDIYEGTILSTDGGKLAIRTTEGLQLSIPFANLDPKSLYQISLGRIGEANGPGQMDLGDEAAACGLWSNAKQHYETAAKDDPSLAAQVDTKVVALRATASNDLLAQAKSAVADQRPDVAEHTLSLLLTNFPHEQAAQEATTMLDGIQGQQAQQRQAAKDARHGQEVQKVLAPAERKYTEMRKKVQEGLQDSQNQTRSISGFEAAVRLGEEGRKELEQSLKSSDAGVTKAAQELDQELVDEIVQAYLDIANVYNQRSSYSDATNVINKGLVLEPKNPQLLSMQAQISSNSASSGAGGWYAGEGRRPRVVHH